MLGGNEMTYDEVKNAPLNVLVGYLVMHRYRCPCACKPEVYEEDVKNKVIKREGVVQATTFCENDCKLSPIYETCPQRLAYERVMKAVQKQMPKKPIQSDSLGSLCPKCGDRLGVFQESFCRNCGQALDWSDCQ